MRNRVLLVFCLVLSSASVCGFVACGSKGGENGDALFDSGVEDGDIYDGSEPTDGELDGGADLPPERSCETVFHFTPEESVGTVELAGEWDWDNPEAMQPDGEGGYSISKTLAPGIWAYKLIVDGNWILDPGNAYRKYYDGTENSGMRVPDCNVPLLKLESFSVNGVDGLVTTVVSFHRAAGGPDVDPGAITVRLQSGDFTETQPDFSYEDHNIHLSIDGLSQGKYTLKFEARDTDGTEAEAVRVPFWVEAEDFDWRDSSIYMIMLDRFRDGDPGNNPGPTVGAEPSADWHGGDLAGVTDAIQEGHFETLGVKALWLSPWVRNPQGSYGDHGRGVTGYHGYWPTRARELDPRFGTEDDLRDMVAAAHEQGIRILMDFVINHVHEDHEYYLSNPEYFRTGCICGEPGCDWTEKRLECLFRPYLPDINWEVHEAGETIIEDAVWWVDTFDLDGLRVDAVKHVEDAAIFNLSTRIREEFEQGNAKYFLLGETAMGWAGDNINDNLSEYHAIGRYIGPYGLDGQFDFVLYHAVSYNVWAYDHYGLIHADYWTQASLDHYPEGAVMTPFISSHDSQRFVSLADPDAAGLVYNKWPDEGLPSAPSTDEPYNRSKTAFAWVLTLPGAPLLYYGDEYAEFGGSDPDNRHMWRPENERSARETDHFEWVARVGRARQESKALRRGEYTSLASEEGFLCFARHTAQDIALVVLNHTGVEITRQIDLPGNLPQPESAFMDYMRPTDPLVQINNGSVTVTVAPRSAAILLPQSP